MISVKAEKYLNILENLQMTVTEDIIQLKKNILKQIKVFETQLEINVDELCNLDTLEKVQFQVDKNSDENWIFIAFICHILITISSEIDVEEEQHLTQKHVEQIIRASRFVGLFGLTPSLPTGILKEPSLKISKCLTILKNPEERYMRITSLILVYGKILKYKALNTKSNHASFIEFFAGYLSILFMSRKQANDNYKLCPDFFKIASDNLYIFNNIYKSICDKLLPENIFIFLMFLRGNSTAPKELKSLMNNCLMSELLKHNGYETFVNVMLQTATPDEPPIWNRFELISNIITAKGLNKEYYNSMTVQILSVMHECLDNPIKKSYLCVSVMSLKKLYDLSFLDVNQYIEQEIVGKLDKLSNPSDILAGIIVFDDVQFKNSLLLNYVAFCGSGQEGLRTKILIPYIPTLFRLYVYLPDNSKEEKQILLMMVQCLGNRNFEELRMLMECILYEEYIQDIKRIHPNIIVKFQDTKYSIQICKDDERPVIDSESISENFVKFCKNSNHNQLVYQIFLTLLKMFDECMDNSKDFTKYLLNEDEVNQIIASKYKKQYIVIHCLNELILFKKFHTQIVAKDMLDFTKNLLQKHINQYELINELDEHIVVLIITIFQEFIPKIEDAQGKKEISVILKELMKIKMSKTLTTHLQVVLNRLEDSLVSPKITKYDYALSLCLQGEPYLKAYGLSEFIKLINEKDTDTIEHRYKILSLTIHLLKDIDSFTFLKCIKLLTLMVNVVEKGVFDSLIPEYQDESADIDLRLKIGEVIVKITESTKVISIAYKDTLINCFMRGAKNINNEYRTSSLSNLGIICKCMNYQIHTYFYEMMEIIQDIILNDKYLPARRGAVLVLSHILFGMQNLKDLEEFLLPIYRTLKSIIISETDEITITHAEIGLEHLKKKTKEFLLPEQKLIKEIKILGIKDDDENQINKTQNLIQIINN